MIDSLFGSRTRVKLLHLFLNNPGRSFYVREITRIIDEQINSVRRELSNMLSIGIIRSQTSENKLYYEANTNYQFYKPLCQIFSNNEINRTTEDLNDIDIQGFDSELDSIITRIPGLKVAIVSGAFLNETSSDLDLLLCGQINVNSAKKLIAQLEKKLGGDIRYTMMTYDDFYYRLSVRDTFITTVLANKYRVLVDTENILGQNSRRTNV